MEQKTAHTDLVTTMDALGREAKKGYRLLSVATTDTKNTALLAAADKMNVEREAIKAANADDMASAEARGLNAAMLDRLQLNDQRIDGMIAAIRQIAELPDPVGEILSSYERPNGLRITKRAVPLGVIGIIYESRPNVTADAAAICLKSGNAAILRGGSESMASSEAIIHCMQHGLRVAGLPEAVIQRVPTRDREAVGVMLGMTDWVDVIIPRGGKGLTERIARDSRIPTLQHLDGNCHIYLHAGAEANTATTVVANAKLRRTGICGAAESLVIDESVIDHLLPAVIDQLEGVELRGDLRARQADSRVIPASDDDWGQEYLASTISVKTVADVEEAITHINHYSSHHTDCIISEDQAAIRRFQNLVDSAIVMHNTSTQFADGGEFGLGAEIGISTGRLHARGPVGCRELTTYKYVVTSDGATRA